MSTADILIPQPEIKLRKPLRRQAPTYSTLFSRPQLIESVSSILSTMLLQSTDSSSADSNPSTTYFAKKVPSISLENYLKRFSEHSLCSTSCFVLMLIFIDKVSEKNPDFSLCPLNIHRIVLLALVTATKYHDDEYFTNKRYAEIGGLKLEELNKLESEFLSNSLNFELYVEESTFKQYEKYCEQYYLKSKKGKE